MDFLSESLLKLIFFFKKIAVIYDLSIYMKNKHDFNPLKFRAYLEYKMRDFLFAHVMFSFAYITFENIISATLDNSFAP